ncbi:MAG: group II truncated hemoglobin [Thalassotalea sp.]|nr:group II truncated hemoglobin [Thalassotalea sp.]
MFGIKKLFSEKNKEKSDSDSLSPSPPLNTDTPYYLIGGEKGTRALSKAFYQEMSSNIHLQELLVVHKEPLADTEEKFFKYLSGWLGGPPLFENEYGHPRLRARHLHVKVTKKQRDLWMLCMTKALEKTVENEELRKGLAQSFSQLATHMINID